MKTINKFLFEFYPEHPSEVIMKNKYYPSGLTELDIYSYYLRNKVRLLKWIANRHVAFTLRLSDRDVVMRRNIKGVPIKFTPKNYDDLITGRTNVVYVRHPTSTNYFIIDIDPGKNLSLKHTEAAAKFLYKENPAKNHELLLSSPTGIHYIGYVNKTQNVVRLKEKIRMVLEEKVNSFNKTSKIQYLVDTKGRATNTINFDLSSMNLNSLHIARYSLTKEFLICDSVERGLHRIKKAKK